MRSLTSSLASNQVTNGSPGPQPGAPPTGITSSQSLPYYAHWQGTATSTILASESESQLALSDVVQVATTPVGRHLGYRVSAAVPSTTSTHLHPHGVLAPPSTILVPPIPHDARPPSVIMAHNTSSPPSSVSNIPKEYRLKVPQLALTCDARRVPDPPVQHFSKNIDHLFEHWNSSMILSVDGRGIPVKYWPDVYKSLGRMKIKPKAWEAIKVEWGNWKVSQ